MKQEYKIALKAGFIIGVAMTLFIFVAKTILLIRMNSNQCIPEESLWEFYEMNYCLVRIPIYTIGMGIVYFIMDKSEGLAFVNFNLEISEKLKNVLKWVSFIFLSLIVLTAIGLLIYGLFIANPCK